MAASLSTVSIKDGDGNLISGDVRAIDESGAGSGPFKTAMALVDGSSVSNALAISAGGAASVAVASGGIASGAIASGAVASGAFASGALASGSVASGAIASGAIAAGAIAAGATSIADNEDAASNDGDRGVKVLAVRKATPADTSGNDGDYEFPQMSTGYLWVAQPKYVKVQSSFTAAGTTPTYTANEWVSDNGTAGSVTKSSWSITRGCGDIRRVRIRKSDQTVATPTIRLWLWDTTFTVAVGNDAAGAQPLADAIGFVDVAVTSAGSDDAVGWTNCDIPFTTSTIFGLLQTLSAFTGATSEVWTIDLWYLPS